MDDARAPADPGGPGGIAVFPLSGTVLLPRARLPLNIFEPRYKALVEDALGEGRIMGMVQTTRAHEGLVPDGAEVFPVGCLGRIVTFAETEDGRYLITLAGLRRFRRLEEVAGRRGYRRWRVDDSAYPADLAPAGAEVPRLVDRAGLLRVVRAYFDARGLSTDWDAVEAASDEALITSLAMACPLGEPRDKQALLESPDTPLRGETLRALLEMELLGGEGRRMRN